MPTAEIKGLELYYERQGTGQPLVLLHGLGASSRTWHHQLSDLSDAFTVIAWDAPGCGRSSDLPGEIPMSGYADYLDALLAAIGIEQAHVLGLSWGGMLAQEFYRCHPARVQSLMLADTFTGGRSRPEADRQRFLEMRMRSVSADPVETARARAAALLSPHASPQLLAELMAISAGRRPEGYRLAFLASSNLDTRDVLPRVKVPALILWGEFDGLTSRSDAEQLRDGIPGAKLVVIPGAGHISNFEQPAHFNAAVRELLGALHPATAAGSAASG